jgi:hypothetical protein
LLWIHILHAAYFCRFLKKGKDVQLPKQNKKKINKLPWCEVSPQLDTLIWSGVEIYLWPWQPPPRKSPARAVPDPRL